MKSYSHRVKAVKDVWAFYGVKKDAFRIRRVPALDLLPAAEKTGIRAILGKVMMDTGSYGQLPPEKIMSQSLAESERLCKKWHGANEGLLEYAFSPRFALSCTPELMEELDLSNSTYGLISSSFFFLFSISGLLVGFLSTRISSRVPATSAS